MTAEIICVGTELLLGDILNTNAQFLSRELAELGISVLHQHVIGDNPARLKELVLQAKSRSDLLDLFRRPRPYRGRPDQGDGGRGLRRYAGL